MLRGRDFALRRIEEAQKRAQEAREAASADRRSHLYAEAQIGLLSALLQITADISETLHTKNAADD